MGIICHPIFMLNMENFRAQISIFGLGSNVCLGYIHSWQIRTGVTDILEKAIAASYPAKMELIENWNNLSIEGTGLIVKNICIRGAGANILFAVKKLH